MLLQKQFRPPVNRVTIEAPSGLIDEGEDICTAALRELKEETGYVATVSGQRRVAEGFVMWNDPGFCNTSESASGLSLRRVVWGGKRLTDPGLWD